VRVRRAYDSDAGAIADIYNQGIEDRTATFVTKRKTADDIRELLAGTGERPFVVVEEDGRVVGWAGLAPYSEVEAYRGVAECALYVAREARGRGVGFSLMHGLIDAAEEAGYEKLVGNLFTTNDVSRALMRRCGFREVGVHRRHGRLDGEWRDVLVVERLLGDAAGPED
jgi:L-amino acid N-acyltransferase YncA